MKALYIVAGIMLLVLLLFFFGRTDFQAQDNTSIFSGELRNMKDFFVVFAIVFPAFTGMTAGVGLSGDLKNPAKSIPLGTILATVTGMVVYLLVIYKLAISASPEDMLDNQLIMAKIAVGGAFFIPLGLAFSTISSALGSIMVAPRTLQALAHDESFPSAKINKWLSFARRSDNEPVNASLVTIVIALVFVALGSINAVAEIISMFFMVTYGSLCLISFLNHFGSSPSYRPSFRSRWYISLAGALIAVWVMFKINTPYAITAIIAMIVIYLYMNFYHKERQGLESLFANALFQINRNLQVYLQKAGSKKKTKEWRPSAICISKDSFERAMAFKLLSWISYSYGFGTYLHRIEGYYSRTTSKQAAEELAKLIEIYDTAHNQVFVDTIISPSYTSAIAQSIQIPGISGMENNMVIFEYDKEDPVNLKEIIENIRLVKSGDFDICLLATSRKEMLYRNGIHVWINFEDAENSSLIILLSFIIAGHPDWKKTNIKVFQVCKAENYKETLDKTSQLVKSGRLPITEKNIEIIIEKPGMTSKKLINEKSALAALVIIGFRTEGLKHNGDVILGGYDDLGTILFVNSHDQKEIV